MSRNTRHALLLLIVGVAAQSAAIAFAVHRTGAIDGYAFSSRDASEYFALAQHLAEAGAFSMDGGQTPDTWRTPGYPAFLALWMLLIDATPAGMVLVQQALSIFNSLLVHRIARNWMDERRALIVALLFLAEPYRLFDSLWLLSTTWFVTVLLMTWYAWDRSNLALERNKPSTNLAWTIVLGVSTGALVLIRPIAMGIPVALAIGLCWRIWRSHRMRKQVEHPDPTCDSTLLWRLGRLCLFAASFFLTVGGWTARNHVIAGQFALTHQSGIVLAYFKATEVELWKQGRSCDRYLETSLDVNQAATPHRVWDDIDRKLRESEAMASLPDEVRSQLVWSNLAQGNKTQADSFAISNELTRIAMRYLLDAPLSTIAVGALGCVEIIVFPLSLAIEPPRGVSPRRFQWMIVGLLYGAAGAAAGYRLLRGRLVWARAFFPIAGTLALLAFSTPQLDARFRVPMMPMLLFLAVMPITDTRARAKNQVAGP